MKNEQVEEQNIECPVCNESFKDLRGLTSHARHAHEMSKEEIYDLYFTEEKDNEDSFWKIAVSAGVFVLSVLTLGKLKI